MSLMSDENWKDKRMNFSDFDELLSAMSLWIARYKTWQRGGVERDMFDVWEVID